MRANNVLGIIFSNAYDSALSEITSLRAMGSVPFCSRYRLIDFPLSSMVNSGISKVGIITKSNYQSLMDHLGTGKPWDLSRKREGMFILPPFLVIIERFLLYKSYHNNQNNTSHNGTYQTKYGAKTVIELSKGYGICQL